LGARPAAAPGGFGSRGMFSGLRAESGFAAAGGMARRPAGDAGTVAVDPATAARLAEQAARAAAEASAAAGGGGGADVYAAYRQDAFVLEAIPELPPPPQLVTRHAYG